MEDDPTPARNNQVNRAASLVISSLSFVRAVRREELPPDTVRGQPLCMYQYLRLFGAARIPTENGCQIVQDPKSRHIVVLCRGQFYWFDVLDENSDLLMTEKELSRNLQIIIQDAQLTPIKDAAKGALGVLSTENRKTWSRLRDIISREQDSTNSECLGIVDSALFILSLDCTEPKNPAELCMTMLCGSSKVENGVQIGTCTNRWYDKLQLIVCKNGSAGINFEHTSVDGHTVLRFASDVYTDTILRFARTINGQAPSLWASETPDPSKRVLSNNERINTTPHKLEWDMIPELSTALRFAETRLADLIQQNEFQTLEFMGYGKSFITSHGFSPDAFVQVAFQAAYYGLYGRLECVYEPAMTKLYLHGRTEAIRSVTLESADFVRTFWDQKPADQKIDMLRRACQKHSEMTKICAKAQGQDRHLFALYNIWQRVANDGLIASPSCKSEIDGKSSLNTASAPDSPSKVNGTSKKENLVCSPDSPVRAVRNLPSVFLDSGWDKLNSTILSTSNCGNPSLRQFGFGPTSGNGFGIGYIIKDGSISICASSKHRQTRRYVDAIESYFLEVRKLLRQLNRRGMSGENGSYQLNREANGEKLQPSRRLNRGRIIQSNVKSSPAAAFTTASNTMATMALSDAEASDADDFGGCKILLLVWSASVFQFLPSPIPKAYIILIFYMLLVFLSAFLKYGSLYYL